MESSFYRDDSNNAFRYKPYHEKPGTYTTLVMQNISTTLYECPHHASYHLKNTLHTRIIQYGHPTNVAIESDNNLDRTGANK